MEEPKETLKEEKTALENAIDHLVVDEVDKIDKGEKRKEKEEE